MAIKEKDTKSPISAAPVAINTPVNPTAAQVIAKAQESSRTALKAPTDSRLKPESGLAAAPQVLAPNGQEKKSEEEVIVDQFRKIELMQSTADLFDNKTDLTDISIEQWAKNNPLEAGKEFDPNDPTDNAYAAFRRANPNDRGITADYESNLYSPISIDPRNRSQAGRNRNAPGAIIDDGFKAPEYKLSKHEARTALASDIKTVSEMYAAEAGLSARDFAKVMSGIATIESSYGVIRSVKGTKYASSAGGAFHYLDGTIAGEVKQNMNDPRIANRVASLGVSINDGVAKSEAYRMKEDNILAGSILAKRIVDIANANPQLKNDIEALTTRVYQSHNLGDAGARALARGGRQALEAVDYRADDNNPMFFRGASSDAEINNRYTKFVGNAIKSSETLVAAAFGGTDTVVASKPNDKKPIRVAAANLHDPAPQPS